MNEEERIKEIRQRTEAATAEKEKGNAIDSAALSWAIVQIDVPYLLDLIESLQDRLYESQRREKAAVRCINDVETYLELGSARYIKRTIDEWRGPQAGEGETNAP